MPEVLIAGAGPAGLYAADRLSEAGISVTLIDSMPSPARKFLMAGRGGLNLTHSENPQQFIERYRAASGFLQPLIEAFPPDALRDWCHNLGQETFVGTSGRVFPTAMKASPLLRALLQRLRSRGVTLLSRHSFKGFAEDGSLVAETPEGGIVHFSADAFLLALGGASWPRLGSTGGWVRAVTDIGINVRPFRPANCGFQVDWSAHLRERFAGAPLKRIALTLAERRVRGEALVSTAGLEGGAVYALSAEIRDAIDRNGQAEIEIDLRPDETAEAIARRLDRPRGKQSMASFLRKALKLGPVEQALLRENGPLPRDPEDLAARVKTISLQSLAPYPIDRAISSAGGIALQEVNGNLMLTKAPGVFVAGEMLDWEAPTGGYLLQACFSMAHCAATGILSFLETGAGVSDQP